MSLRYVLDLISEVKFYSKLPSCSPFIKTDFQWGRGK